MVSSDRDLKIQWIPAGVTFIRYIIFESSCFVARPEDQQCVVFVIFPHFFLENEWKQVTTVSNFLLLL
jgi:hypothetical protein